MYVYSLDNQEYFEGDMVYKSKNESANPEVIIYINLIIPFSAMYVYSSVICRLI